MARSWDAAAGRAQERLAAAPGVRAVGEDEGRGFALRDLASCAEGELGEHIDPEAIGPAEERRLRERLGESGREWPGGELYRRRYWLLDDRSGEPAGTGAAEPVGTLAVDNWTRGPGQLAVSSLYLRPSARGRGLAAAALDRVYRAATAEGLPGYRLQAHWTWQHAVRYYLRRGLWVVSWKHALGLARMPQLPPYRVREEDGRLVLLVADRPCPDPDGAVWTPLLAAASEGGRLRLDETAAYRQADGWVHGYARSTLALHLALAGRPLVRGPQWWAEAWRWADTGEPEGLAYRIAQFEEYARAQGRTVATPYRPPAVPVGVPRPAEEPRPAQEQHHPDTTAPPPAGRRVDPLSPPDGPPRATRPTGVPHWAGSAGRPRRLRPPDTELRSPPCPQGLCPPAPCPPAPCLPGPRPPCTNPSSTRSAGPRCSASPGSAPASPRRSTPRPSS
ncbi:GNAT family N-acetyltransferase [Kitasatospora sp. NPDC097605]|uniref:GNAT family N-acetyltransferase n=1 Tax=Kitasatospora sp. NPDC097605 TaxID=3157226 RepID=UPI0033187855